MADKDFSHKPKETTNIRVLNSQGQVIRDMQYRTRHHGNLPLGEHVAILVTNDGWPKELVGATAEDISSRCNIVSWEDAVNDPGKEKFAKVVIQMKEAI